jgi:hypothetical protein
VYADTANYKYREKPSFGKPVCQDTSLGAEEINSVKFSEFAVAE